MKKKLTPCSNLREWRERHKLSQRAAAAQFGLSQATWNKYELGYVTPRKARLERLARETGVPLAVLTGVAL